MLDRPGMVDSVHIMNRSPADENRKNPQPPPQDDFAAWVWSQADQEREES
jgi:hypothetical protein